MHEGYNHESPLEKPIPLEIPSVAGWKEVPIREPERPEPLVPLGPFSDHDAIFTSSVYFGEHKNSPYQHEVLQGALATTFVREGVAEQLRQAQAQLPRGKHLVVFDAYRTLEVQQALYDVYFNELQRQYPDWSEGQLSAETQKFVSLPRSPKLDSETKFVSPHNTGGAVDLAIYDLPEEIEAEVEVINKEVAELDTRPVEEAWERIYALQMRKYGLIREHARPLDFGTAFDHGGEQAALNHFERLSQERELTNEEKEAQFNRRLLYNVMINAGFEPYADEWWHYNSKMTQMGARTAGLDHAEYGAAELSFENQEHEEMRVDHRAGNIAVLESRPIFMNPSLERHFSAVLNAATGDIRNIVMHQAEIIKPPEKTQ